MFSSDKDRRQVWLSETGNDSSMSIAPGSCLSVVHATWFSLAPLVPAYQMFHIQPACSGFNPDQNTELVASHSDIIGLIPGASDWPYVPLEVVSGPHISCSGGVGTTRPELPTTW